MTDQLDCVIVGAGVIGLAIARSLALAGREVIVLEAESEIGMHTSSRNSEVIHAGLYYPEGSLKATLCVKGRTLLYDYCERHHVPYKRIGKLIVASHKAEKDKLLAIRSQAVRNGVMDLRLVEKEEIQSLEPAITGQLGLLSPSTGIIDSHSLMMAFLADIEANNGAILKRSRLQGASVTRHGFKLQIEGTDAEVECKTLVNAGGLLAESVARSISGLDPEKISKIRYAKGHYFAYGGKSPFRHLVYPLPTDGGLGVHATNDLSGALRFGPDVEWIDSIDYEFDASRLQHFVESIKKYFPGLDIDKMSPGYTGIRPKISGPGESPQDFVIQGAQSHGVNGLVNLFGIESPGLTSALAIGDYVSALLRRHST